MPQGNVRLFRDEYLNNHPILLGYLAQSADGSVDESSSVTQRDSSPEPSPNAKNGAGFVERMRATNLELDASTPSQMEEISLEDSGSFVPMLSSLKASMRTKHAAMDPSDPNTTIRKLVKHIERLQVSTSFRFCSIGMTDKLIGKG